MSSFGDETPTLIRTKLHRPSLGEDLISRPHLIQWLNQGIDRKLTLISAQAGAGKSTLLAQWLEECPQPSAWLSLDLGDNDPMVFASYLCAAIQTVFPNACEQALALLNAPQSPPPRIIATSLVNELDVLCGSSLSSDEEGNWRIGLILAIDDYHNITDPVIHELLSDLIAYLPQCVHLVLSSRTDPPLPLAGLRARDEMTELRTVDLRFTSKEAEVLLEWTIGRELSSDTVDLLKDKTDGWVVGLRLVALSIRDLPDGKNFVERFEGTSSSIIVDYLVSEVLSQQSPVHQDFLLRTSILERFNAELCDAILWQGEDPISGTPHPGVTPSQNILGELRSANLFLHPLNQEGSWYRYHHLFRDLLQHRLQRQQNQEYIRTLHNHASRWFEENGLVEEALTHAFSAGDLDRASRIVSRQRYRLMNQARWQRLDRYLRRFPPEYASQQSDLLMLKTWLAYHQGHFGQLPALVAKIEASLDQKTLSPETIGHLKGEISALKSLIHYFQTNEELAIVEAEFSIKNTPPELWIVRILARLFLAGAYQMRGELRRAYDAYYQGLDEEVVQSNRFKATLLMSSCNLPWIAADLQHLEGAAGQCIALCDFPHSAEIKGYGSYHLGRVYYQRNDLEAAKEHFATVVQQPYLNYGQCFADSAFCLGLIYQAQNRPDEALEIASLAVAHMLDTGNTTLLPVALAFQAEIALRQGQLAAADQWASQFESIPPIMPMFRMYEPHFTLVKIWLAHKTPANRRQAAEILDQLRNYAETVHNHYCLMQVMALLAILHAAEENEPATLAQLENALELAQPGGFIRLFVDLGLPMAHLLQTLHGQGVSPEYLSQYLARILAAFPGSAFDQNQFDAGIGLVPPPVLVDPLTSREMEVLELLAQRQTNKEIAEKLVVAPETVKSHTLSIYAKLDVHGRRQAVDKAGEIGLLSPT